MDDDENICVWKYVYKISPVDYNYICSYYFYQSEIIDLIPEKDSKWELAGVRHWAEPHF